MTVLLVDDQIHILSGLISGVDWDSLNVTNIRTATNAQTAREILQAEHVDILLCDIEMPGENGLSLLRWARREGYDFVCIFLTSHADFLYAKEAIQLDCFDYVLQPARYDDIQATIARAIKRVANTNVQKSLQAYGAIAKNNTMSLFQNLFRDWSIGEELSLSALRRILEQLGQKIQLTDECFVIQGHLLNWQKEPWPTQEWQFSINNIVMEVYTLSGEVCSPKDIRYGMPSGYALADCKILSFTIDSTSIGWFVYTTGGCFPKDMDVLQPLQKAYEAVTKYLSCGFAFYVTPVVPLEQLNSQSKPLLCAKQNNVLHKKGIFPLSGQKRHPEAVRPLDTEQLMRWGTLLENGGGELAEEEILQVLDKAAAAGQLNQTSLHTFWIQFQQVVLNTLWKAESENNEIFKELEKGEKAQSLLEMKAAIHSVVTHFTENPELSDTRSNMIEKVKNYVEDHLNETLNVNEVAEVLFMNADYLSRLFKSETGMPLKKYIIKRKMETAQILLKTTMLPISIIASKIGYDNFSYFSRAYRKEMGISPTEERD